MADPQLMFRFNEPGIRAAVERANNEAWNWEDCTYRAHLYGLTAKQFWLVIKMARWADRVTIPLTDRSGKPFTYRLPAEAFRVLHLIDKHLGGSVGTSFPQLGSEADRNRYLLTSLREEAISSSQIEGAVVTREVAKELLRTKRAPRTEHERMVLNNYLTIRMVNDRHGEPVTPDVVCEIQRRLTDGTLAPTALARFRRADEDIAVWDDEDNVRLHVPPAAGELPDRVRRMCDFANEADSGKAGFIHPAVRAIILHFWLAYDHPFVDGNGRTARALFYWSMLRDGYWLAEYLTISTVINGQKKRYARAYLDTEHDDNDLTYFIVYHLSVIEQSITAFRAYLERKIRDQREATRVLAGPFNNRQRALLALASRNPTARFTYSSHAASHGVSIPTARADLLDLEAHDLLTSRRVGRQLEFAPAPGLEARIRQIADGQ